MTREEAIELLVNATYSDEWQGNEDLTTAHEMAIEALKQEIGLDRDCEHCSKTYGTLGCCDTVSNKWVYSCKEGQREYLLGKIKAEIKEWYWQADKQALAKDPCVVDAMVDLFIRTINKYKAESNG